MSEYFLLVESGPDSGKQYDLTEEDCVIGRHPDCHLVIDQGAVSRQHAQITFEEDGYFIEDLKSRNKTYRNGALLRGKHRLRHGDFIEICGIEISYHGNPESSSYDSISDSSKSGQLVMEEQANSTVLSKLDVSSNRGAVHLSATAEAKLAAVLEILGSIGHTVALDDVLPKVLDALFKIYMQADRAFVILSEPDGALIPRYTKVRRDDESATLRISSSIVRDVMEGKEAILSADAANDEQWKANESVANFQIRSMMCAPLIDGSGAVLGVLQIDTQDQKKRFEQSDLEVLNTVASAAAVSISVAHLHQRELHQLEVDRDLDLAKEVQRSFLPEVRPELPGYEFFDYYRPAAQVGGDYYDYIQLPDGRLAIVIADIVGHGVAAALLMAKLSAETRFCLASNANMADAVTDLNARFSRLPISRFATMLVVALDPKHHEMTIVNCGHPPPMIRRANGELEEPSLSLSGVAVGIVPDVVYQQFLVSLGEGERVVLFTDGVNEAMDDAESEFGRHRIRELIKQSQDPLGVFGQHVINEVDAFRNGKEQDDDMCIVCFERA